jgi:cell wall-associated NlpC family hydrolase
MLAMGAFAVSAFDAFAQAPAPAPDSAPAPAAPAGPGPADVATAMAASGGVGYGVPAVQPVTAAPQATLGADGLAQAPAGAPPQVQEAIWAANAIIGKPYRYGGGHRRFIDSGYDCSGSVSFALRGGGLVKRPLHSSAFMSWGEAGRGQWITVYTNPGHAFVVIAGLRFDTSGPGPRGPNWRKTARSSRAYTARHPTGF